MYDGKALSLTVATSSCLETFEMWCYRWMLRISWTHHIINESVLQRMTIGRLWWRLSKRKNVCTLVILNKTKNTASCRLLKWAKMSQNDRQKPLRIWHKKKIFKCLVPTSRNVFFLKTIFISSLHLYIQVKCILYAVNNLWITAD